MNIARSEHCALNIGGRVFVFGGVSKYDTMSSSNALSSIECCDENENWKGARELCEKRFYLQWHRAIYTLK